MKRGDILVDDYLKYRKLWIDAGGIFVHYDNESPDSAAKTLGELARLGLDVKQPPALFSRQTRHSIEPPVQLSLEQHS